MYNLNDTFNQLATDQPVWTNKWNDNRIDTHKRLINKIKYILANDQPEKNILQWTTDFIITEAEIND